MGEDALVLQRVMTGDDPAIARAIRTQRPLVLADRHLVDEGPRRTDVDRALRHLLDQIAELAQLVAQGIVDVDQMLAGGLLIGGVAAPGIGCGPGRPSTLIPRFRSAEPRSIIGGGDHRQGGRALPESWWLRLGGRRRRRPSVRPAAAAALA